MAFFVTRDARGRVRSLHNINTENTWIIYKTGRGNLQGRAVDGKLKSNLEWPKQAINFAWHKHQIRLHCC